MGAMELLDRDTDRCLLSIVGDAFASSARRCGKKHHGYTEYSGEGAINHEIGHEELLRCGRRR